MTDRDVAADSVVGATVGQRWRSARWVLLALAVIVGVATLGALLTGPRPGGRLDPSSTSPDGAHALIALLRDRGVDIVTAGDVAAVERAARPGDLVVVVQTRYLLDEDLLRRLADLPGDRLVVEPLSRTSEALAPAVTLDGPTPFGTARPGCALRAATLAGDVRFGLSDAYTAAGDLAVTRCYQGALVRYTDGDRAVTVVGSSEFMTNSGLLDGGNAALAMNLAGSNPRMIWYAPQQLEGEPGAAADIVDLIPDRALWVVLQLALVVVLVAAWKGRRLGPLVAERLPVVVRASETVEGRGRLYRSRRATDRAAESLRTATLQRILPRLGLSHHAAPGVVVQAVAGRCRQHPQALAHTLFGPAPETDADLVNLSHALDDIERQVAQS